MILTEKVTIRVLNLLVKHYSERGYVCSPNSYIEVKVEDLSHGANVEILCKCEVCDKEFIKKYRLIKIVNGTTHCNHCRMSISSKKRIHEYGSNFKNSDIQRKIATKYTGNIEKTKEKQEKRRATNIKKYGSTNNQEKRLNTIEKRGGDWNNSVKFRKFNDILLYQGSFEKDFLDNFFHEIIIERGKTFIYDDENGKKHRYFSDFYVPSLNLIVEIKSSFTWNYDKNKYLKKESVIRNGYNFIWVVDKNYDILVELLNR